MNVVSLSAVESRDMSCFGRFKGGYQYRERSVGCVCGGSFLCYVTVSVPCSSFFISDQFITCPVINMASHWAATSRGNVFMYHVPESSSQSR